MYRNVSSNSVCMLIHVGLAKGLQERMCDVGLPLSLPQPHLPRTIEKSLTAQLQHRQQIRWTWTLAPTNLRAQPSVRTGVGSDAQMVSKGIACV